MLNNICVIGLGSMGKRRIRLLKHIDPAIEIVGIDNNQVRVDEVAKLYGIKCYNQIEEINDCDVQIAFIATAPSSHGKLIKECLGRGWHVFTEINLVTDFYEGNIQLAKEKELTLFLSSTPLYRDEMIAIHQEISKTKECLNYIYHIGQYLPDWHPWETINDFFVNNTRTNGCREIFAIELPWLIKTFGQIKSVRSLGRKMTTLQVDYKDSYFVQIEHESGHVGIMAVDVVCREAVRKLEIYGETTYITWAGTPDTLKYKNLETGNMESLTDSLYLHEKQYGAFINEYAYLEEIETFFRVLNGEQPQYSFEDDYKILEIIDEIEGKSI